MSSQVILATAGYDHTIKLWEATSGICYRTLQYADSQVHPRQVLHALGNCITQIHRRQITSLMCTWQVNKLEITTDKRLLAAAGNPQIRLFEVASGNNQAVLTYEGHSSNVTAVCCLCSSPHACLCVVFAKSFKAQTPTSEARHQCIYTAHSPMTKYFSTDA